MFVSIAGYLYRKTTCTDGNCQTMLLSNSYQLLEFEG
jgi:hypothetical protein